MYLNIVKAIHDKPKVNIILNGEKLKPCPLKSGTRHSCPLSSLQFNRDFEFLAKAIRQEEIKIIQTCNKVFKLTLSAEDIYILVT
jgi:hypothetical protein